MMNEDKSLCEKDTQVLECVKKYTQDIDIPVLSLVQNTRAPFEYESPNLDLSENGSAKFHEM